MNEIGIHFGALADRLDKQLKQQGFKDKKCKRHQQDIYSLQALVFHDMITDKQRESIEKKIVKDVTKSVEKITEDEEKYDKKYIILTLRHECSFGKKYCLFWGYDDSPSSYTSDPYHAHRFNLPEALDICDGKEDIMLDISKLGLDESYKDHNKNVVCLVEKGQVNCVYGLKIRR